MHWYIKWINRKPESIASSELNFVKFQGRSPGLQLEVTVGTRCTMAYIGWLGVVGTTGTEIESFAGAGKQNRKRLPVDAIDSRTLRWMELDGVASGGSQTSARSACGVSACAVVLLRTLQTNWTGIALPIMVRVPRWDSTVERLCMCCFSKDHDIFGSVMFNLSLLNLIRNGPLHQYFNLIQVNQ